MSEEIDKPKKVEQKADGSGVFDRSAHVKAMQEKAKASTHDFSKSGKKGAAISKDRARKRQEREKKLADAKEKIFEYLPNEYKKGLDILTKCLPEAAQAMVDSLRQSIAEGDVAVSAKKAETLISLTISNTERSAKLNKAIEGWVLSDKKEDLSDIGTQDSEDTNSSNVVLQWNYVPKENAS